MDENKEVIMDNNEDVKELKTILNEIDTSKKEEYKPLSMANWFTTFMFMGVPLFGLFYLIYLACSSKQPLKKDFAKAYLLYQFIFLGIALVIIFICVWLGLEVADNALKFMQEL